MKLRRGARQRAEAHRSAAAIELYDQLAEASMEPGTQVRLHPGELRIHRHAETGKPDWLIMFDAR